MKSAQRHDGRAKPRTIAFVIPDPDPKKNKKNRADIKLLAKKKKFSPVEFIVETESSTKPWQQRTIKKVIDQLQKGDRLLVHELWRLALGRTGIEIYAMMREMQGKGIELYSVKGGWDFNGMFRFPAGG